MQDKTKQVNTSAIQYTTIQYKNKTRQCINNTIQCNNIQNKTSTTLYNTIQCNTRKDNIRKTETINTTQCNILARQDNTIQYKAIQDKTRQDNNKTIHIRDKARQGP